MINNTHNVFPIYAVAWPTLGKLLIPWCLTVTPPPFVIMETKLACMYMHMHICCAMLAGGQACHRVEAEDRPQLCKVCCDSEGHSQRPGLSHQMSPSAEPSQQPNAPHFSEVSFPSHQMCWMRYRGWQCAMPWPLRFHRALRDLSARNTPFTESQPSLKWQWHQPLKTDAYNPTSRKYEFW